MQKCVKLHRNQKNTLFFECQIVQVVMTISIYGSVNSLRILFRFELKGRKSAYFRILLLDFLSYLIGQKIKHG